MTGRCINAARIILSMMFLVMACFFLLPSNGEAQKQEMRGGKLAQKADGDSRGGGRQRSPSSTFYTKVPAHDFDLILGRPSRHSVTISVLAYGAIEGYITYGASEEETDLKTNRFRFEEGQPQERLLDGLDPDTQYHYRLHWQRPGTEDFVKDTTHTFHTQRPPGVPFTFTVQADSHLDQPQAAVLYSQTLHSAVKDNPDFHVDLGDTFMTDKRRDDYMAALPQYIAQRYYFGLLCHSAPLFLVLGNHDGESGRRFNSRKDSMAGWSNAMRKRYFPNPLPNDCYTGNVNPVEPLGLLEDYYAWEWGDALFVVLDPYWFTAAQDGNEDGFWTRTLGEEQYRWLAKTLEKSKAHFKFIFIHNLVGGADSSMRGGAEAARYFEWGGHDLDGRYTFQEKRPGWLAPIHELLKRYGANVVFHGHDHFFAHQELDGITYQLVPQPSHPGGREVGCMAAEYGYVSGDFFPSPGYLRVSVSSTSTTVAYIQMRKPITEEVARNVSEPVFEYRLNARANN